MSETAADSVTTAILVAAALWPAAVWLIVGYRERQKPNRHTGLEFAIGMMCLPALFTAGLYGIGRVSRPTEPGLALIVMPYVGAAYGAAWMVIFLIVRWFLTLTNE